jgi:hypothetical protein
LAELGGNILYRDDGRILAVENGNTTVIES